MPHDLFPLPLTPFEYYYWCDDRPEYPTTYPVELVFSPPLSRQTFQNALERVIVRHPLLMSLVAEDGRLGPCWIGNGELVAVDWSDEKTPIHPADGQRIDLCRSPGMRIQARNGQDATRMIFQFHHACCDAYGSFKFIEDVMIAYAQECGDAIATLSPLEPALLRRRGEYDLPDPSFWTTIRDWWIGGKIWTKFAMQSPAVLAAKKGSAAITHDFTPAKEPHSFISRVLDAEFLQQLRVLSRNTGCSINDILLCGLFLAVRDWNAAYRKPHGPLRINMPVLMLERKTMAMPAANRLSFAFLTRNTRDCDAPRKLLESIRRETEAIKRCRLGLYFVGGLKTFRGVPGLIPWFLHQPRCRATVVLSYGGRLFAHAPLQRQEGKIVCGQSVLQSVAGVPPIRPLTRAAIFAMSYAGRTSLNLQCDPRFFDAQAQEEFMAEYVGHIMSLSQNSPLPLGKC
jgi:hypothetical protein